VSKIKLSELRAARAAVAAHPGSVVHVRTYLAGTLANGLLATYNAADALIEVVEAARRMRQTHRDYAGSGEHYSARCANAESALDSAIAKFEVE